jgi:hypothetical protein
MESGRFSNFMSAVLAIGGAVGLVASGAREHFLIEE